MKYITKWQNDIKEDLLTLFCLVCLLTLPRLEIIISSFLTFYFIEIGSISFST